MSDYYKSNTKDPLEKAKRDLRAVRTIVEKMGVSFAEANVVMLNLRKIVKPEFKSKKR